MNFCLKVRRENAEEERRKLASKGLLDNAYIPKRGRKYVYFPIIDGKESQVKAGLVKKLLKRRGDRPKSLKEALAGRLKEEEMDELIASYDLVGDIAVVEIPAKLKRKERLIAKAIMSTHKNVKVVAKKIGGTSGEYRIRPVKVIMGEKRTFATCKEAGCLFDLDLNEVYFSSRLGTERGRVALQVKPNENVLVPFAGVGPFAIRIAKQEKSAHVVGIELNPKACGFFKANVEKNKCKNIEVIEGDVSKILPGRYEGWADRVVMPLPKDASQYLASVLPCLKKGGILHYYAFGAMESPFDAAKEEIASFAALLNRRAVFLFERVVRPYSKTKQQVVVDAKII